MLSAESQTAHDRPETAPELVRVVPVSGGARIDHSLTYRVPEKLRRQVRVGSVVAVPVQKSVRTGVVVAFEQKDEEIEASPYVIREIAALFTEEEMLRPQDVEVARWMGSYYACGYKDALAPFTPEIRALQAVRVLVADKPESFLESLNSLGLLFIVEGGIELDRLPDGRNRVVRSELEEALKSAGLNERDVSRTIALWLDSGVLREEIGIRTRVRHIGKSSYLAVTEKAKEADFAGIRSARQVQVIRLIDEMGGVLPREEVVREIPSAQSAVAALVRKGFLEEIIDASLLPVSNLPPPQISLSTAQTEAVRAITQALETGKAQTFLLFGVTGSGKTEVYIEVCKRAVELGKRATVLVPEIALTHQAVRRFMQSFPRKVALLHSELTERERLHEWRLVRRGLRDIVIGARSALFAPLPNRGLIIIDEESETAYKQHQRPKYHARDVARRMSMTENSVLVLGSATPSIESFYAAKKGTFKLLRLPGRVVGGSLPEVRVVCPSLQESAEEEDTEPRMILDGKETTARLLSPMLREELKRTLDSGRQAMLFLNLRAFARSLICTRCGWVARCPQCEISLAYHRSDSAQVCHHCGYRQAASESCVKCGHASMRFLGWGTERLEAEVHALFPSARLMRMDRDTVVSRGKRRAIVDAMRRHDVDILLGTQMIAKGLDFPAVRLVGVISADQSLHIPDFRASERTFQLITQVIGRAGRSDDLQREGGGIAIIQTYNPENRVIRLACAQDFETFYETELQLRLRFGYPPATHLARVIVSASDRETAADTAALFKKKLDAFRPREEVSALGPAPAPLEKLEGLWRFHLILKAEKVSVLVKWLLSARRGFRIPSAVRFEIDVDPISML